MISNRNRAERYVDFDEMEWQAPSLEEPTEPEPMQRTWGHDFGDFLIQHIEESRSSS